MTAQNSSVSHIQWGVAVKGKGWGGGILVRATAGYHDAASIRRQAGGPGAGEKRLTGGAYTSGRGLPYSGGVRAADRCNRNRAGQVGAGIVKCWLGGALLACSSAVGGGAGPGGAGEEDVLDRGL